MYPLRYLPSGHIYIDSDDDCHKLVDAMLETDYSEEFIMSQDFSIGFAERLMEAGFLVMSMELKIDKGSVPGETETSIFILLPKLHLVRSALFYPNLRIKKNIKPLLPHYELRVNTDFEYILDKCVKTHGSDWLTPPLVNLLKTMNRLREGKNKNKHPEQPLPFSFSLYRDGELKAGEIGIVMGRVYTSYSGYRTENNSGTVQMILMIKWLEENGFDFLDFGMPLPYKTDLGAADISPAEFVDIFRAAQRE